MAEEPVEHRFYGELATWWPYISPADEYADEARFATTLLASATGPVRDVLELGSGGGHIASHLKTRFVMTLVDASSAMLDVSQDRNPECVHHQGDLRTVRLGRTFDAVFVHDAVGYMTSEADLRRAADTAFLHCRPGGVTVWVPDEVMEAFEPDTEHGGVDGPDGRAARYLEWTWDPDPSDTWVLTEYVFLLRESDGSVRAVHETHRLGVFSRDVWRRVLTEAGFAVRVVEEELSADEAEERVPREIFVARRPE